MRKITEIRVFGLHSVPQNFPEGQDTELKPFYKERKNLYCSRRFSGETKFFKIGKLDKPIHLKFDDNCKIYSEHPKELEKLVSEIKVMAMFDRYGKFFSDGDERNIFKITIERGGRKIEFEFGTSIVDSSVNMAPSMYDILCVLRSESYCPIDFDEFCSEFGYNTDSIKAAKAHRECLKMRAKVERIFRSEELEYLPS